MMIYCQLNPQEQISVRFESEFSDFNQQNAFENIVCKMSAISIRSQYAKIIDGCN